MHKLGLGTMAIGNALQRCQQTASYGGRNAFGAVLKAGAGLSTDFGRLRNEAVNTGISDWTVCSRLT